MLATTTATITPRMPVPPRLRFGIGAMLIRAITLRYLSARFRGDKLFSSQTRNLARIGAAFYDPGYKATISRMASFIIEVEGPVYDDVLVMRIARVHGFQRTGSTIQKLALSAIDHRFPRTTEDGRDVFWSAGAQTGVPVSFRKSADNIRSHNDIPIPELASLALPFVRIRMDDEQVVRKLAEHFELGRLREVVK